MVRSLCSTLPRADISCFCANHQLWASRRNRIGLPCVAENAYTVKGLPTQAKPYSSKSQVDMIGQGESDTVNPSILAIPLRSLDDMLSLVRRLSFKGGVSRLQHQQGSQSSRKPLHDCCKRNACFIMRIVNTATLELHEFSELQIPVYASLSRSGDAGKVTFKDVVKKKKTRRLRSWTRKCFIRSKHQVEEFLHVVFVAASSTTCMIKIPSPFSQPSPEAFPAADTICTFVD